jgi:hypothetical protein
MSSITLPKRATVEPDFVDTMIEIYSQWLKAISAAKNNENFMEQKKGNIARLLPIVRRQNPSLHSGLEYEITRLRGLAYEKFYSYVGPDGQKYIVGLTNPITIRVYSNNEILGKLGKYRVYLPMKLFATCNLGDLHMIPENNLFSVFRHPHHYIAAWPDESYLSSSNRQSEKIYKGNPLVGKTGNCWGDTTHSLRGSVEDPDIPAVFAILHRHLSTWGTQPPITMGLLDFPWEKK